MMRLSSFLLILGLCCPSPSFAQTPPVIPGNIDPAEELEREREEEQRREDLENFQRRQLGVPDSQDLKSTGALDAGPCIDIDRITVDGAVTLTAKNRLDEVIAGYAPDCMSRADIAAVMKSIDDAYVDLGLITSRAYIEKQDFKDGVLRLKVVEGFVEDIVFTDSEGKKEPDTRRDTAFPNRIGTTLQLRDFEQGLDQINRLQSAKAKLKLSPGEKPGGTVVNVSVADKHRFRTFASWNNYGSPSTGKDQFRLGVAADNVLWANDTWSASYVGTLDSNALSANMSVPLGFATLSLGGLASDYLIVLTPSSELFGDTISGYGSFNWVFDRDSSTKTFMEVGLQARQSRRFINSFELEPQSLTTLRVTLGQIIETKAAKISIDGTYVRGLKLFGVTRDRDATSGRDPNAQFEALEFGITRLPRPKKWGRWIVSARGKISTEGLYGPEQTPLGARSTVRGFRMSAISADTAAYIRNDLILNMPDGWKEWAMTLPGGEKGWLSMAALNLHPYGFLDMGVGYAHADMQAELVGGAGFGLQLRGKRANFDFGYEIPIAKREFREFNAPRFLARIGVNWP